MNHLTAIAIDVLRYAADGNRPVFLGHGVVDASPSYMIDSVESNGDYRDLNLRVLEELVEAGAIDLFPEPSILCRPVVWPEARDQWIDALRRLWPENGILPPEVGFWLQYQATVKGLAMAFPHL